MTEAGKLAGPVMRGAACFDADKAGFKTGEKSEHLRCDAGFCEEQHVHSNQQHEAEKPALRDRGQYV